MRFLSIALVSVTACVGLAPAHASSAGSTIPVQGTVGGTCTSGTTAGRDVTLSTTAGPNGNLDSTFVGQTWVVPGWYCNGPSQISIKATSLRLTPPQTSLKNNESQTVNYTAHATGWSASEARVTTGETNALGTATQYTGAAQNQTSAKSGSITISVDGFTIVGGAGKATAKLVRGSYSARIVVTLTPGI